MRTDCVQQSQYESNISQYEAAHWLLATVLDPSCAVSYWRVWKWCDGSDGSRVLGGAVCWVFPRFCTGKGKKSLLVHFLVALCSIFRPRIDMSCNIWLLCLELDAIKTWMEGIQETLWPILHAHRSLCLVCCCGKFLQCGFIHLDFQMRYFQWLWSFQAYFILRQILKKFPIPGDDILQNVCLHSFLSPPPAWSFQQPRIKVGKMSNTELKISSWLLHMQQQLWKC